MLNLCLFIFIVNAVGGSARVILFGRKSKKSRLVYAYETRRRRAARRRRSSYEKCAAAKHRRLYTTKSYEKAITYKNQRREKCPALLFCMGYYAILVITVKTIIKVKTAIVSGAER